MFEWAARPQNPRWLSRTTWCICKASLICFTVQGLWLFVYKVNSLAGGVPVGTDLSLRAGAWGVGVTQSRSSLLPLGGFYLAGHCPLPIYFYFSISLFFLFLIWYFLLSRHTRQDVNKANTREADIAGTLWNPEERPWIQTPNKAWMDNEWRKGAGRRAWAMEGKRSWKTVPDP